MVALCIFPRGGCGRSYCPPSPKQFSTWLFPPSCCPAAILGPTNWEWSQPAKFQSQCAKNDCSRDCPSSGSQRSCQSAAALRITRSQQEGRTGSQLPQQSFLQHSHQTGCRNNWCLKLIIQVWLAHAVNWNGKGETYFRMQMENIILNDYICKRYPSKLKKQNNKIQHNQGGRFSSTHSLLCKLFSKEIVCLFSLTGEQSIVLPYSNS